MTEVWFRPLVWMDFRLAVLFTVFTPLVLLVWAFIKKQDAVQHLLVIYWRVASLLGISVYLLIGQSPYGYLSGWLARVLIPISLWFWIDLNEEIDDMPRRPLKLALTAWRWAIAFYCAIAVVATMPFLSCAFSAAARATDFCRVWQEPPLLYKQWFHPEATTGLLGFVGVAGLLIYVVAFGYFLIFGLTKTGRIASEE